MATSKKTTTYTAPAYKNKTTYTAPVYKGIAPYKTTTYKGYTGDTAMAQNTVPKAKKVTKVKGGTNAANQGLAYLNQLDTNVGGLYGNASQILIDNGALQAIEKARKNMQKMTNRQYNDNANTYYQMYRQNQTKLPESLSRLGVTGGGSETAALGLLNNYAGNLYNNESARANALNEGNMKFDQMVADNSVALSKQLADMYYNLGKGFLDERRANARNDWEWNRGVNYDTYKYNRDIGRSDWEWNRDVNYDRYLFNRDAGYDKYKWDRDVDYDRYKFNRDVGYGDYTYNRDIAREDQLYNRNIAREDQLYNRNISREDELNAYDRALAQAQYTGDFSVMKRFGWSDSDVSKANSLMANSGTSGGSGGYRSYYGSGGYGGSDTDTDYVLPETQEETGLTNAPNLYWNPDYGKSIKSNSTKVNTSAMPYKSDKTGVTLNARDVSLYDDRNKYTKRYAYTR